MTAKEMSINLRPHSSENPLWIEDDEYQRLVQRKEGGWSRCQDETEWLAKLHYLRGGLREGKVTPEDFEKREMQLVLGWFRGRS
jgi:hypothetical protein